MQVPNGKLSMLYLMKYVNLNNILKLLSPAFLGENMFQREKNISGLIHQSIQLIETNCSIYFLSLVEKKEKQTVPHSVTKMFG